VTAEFVARTPAMNRTTTTTPGSVRGFQNDLDDRFAAEAVRPEFRPNDLVEHTSKSLPYRGCVGTVTYVHDSKITVSWTSGSKQGTCSNVNKTSLRKLPATTV